MIEEAIDLLQYCGERMVFLEGIKCSSLPMAYDIGNNRGFPVSIKSRCGVMRLMPRKLSKFKIHSGNESKVEFNEFLKGY